VARANPASFVTVETLRDKFDAPEMTRPHWCRFSCGQPTRSVSAAVTAEDDCDAALHALEGAGLSLPVVAKPDLGCRGAGVKLVRTQQDLTAYLAAFPRGARLLLQQLVPHEGEAGIFYVRAPGAARGATSPI
jgi:biotin carboxylase